MHTCVPSRRRCGKTHNQNDYSMSDKSRLAEAGFGLNPDWKLHKKHGWRLAKTNLEECKSACDVVGCAEISIKGKLCFVAKRVCHGTKRKKDTKWVVQTVTPDCPAPTAAGQGSREEMIL